MPSYIQSINGYVADVAEIYFKRCDGKVFFFDEASSSSFTPTFNQQEINGGWGLFPRAHINTGSTLEASFTSAQFTMDMFEGMSNTNLVTDSAFEMWKNGLFTVDANLAIKIPETIVAGSSFIFGSSYVSGAVTSAGKHTEEAVDAAGEVPAHTMIEFHTGDVAKDDIVRVVYRVVKTAERAKVLTNSTSARGEVTMKWPVYSSGVDCTEAAIKGYVILTIYMARVTAMPGFDTSFKTAATNSVTFAAIDPRRSDGQMYSVSYVAA